MMKSMMDTLEETAGTDSVAARPDAGTLPAGKSRGLSVAVLYEDSGLRQWAREVCDRVAQLVGPEAVRCTWWNLGDLSEPAVLAGAVSTALRADIIVIAVHAAEGFPLPFYVWVDSWLPHRPPGTGALVGLVAFPEWLSPPMDRAREYLQAVAREGRMDFLFEERRSEPTGLAADESSSLAPMEEDEPAKADRVSAPAPVFRCPEFED